MSVYVDGEKNGFGRMIMCHMVADSLEELHRFAVRIGMKREWFQNHPRHPHYDVCQSKRTLAVKLGAIPIDRRAMVAKIREIESGSTKPVQPDLF